MRIFSGGAEIVLGCCGWPVGRARYFGAFGAVELQDTFYQPPSPELAAKWRAVAPTQFRFTMKAWQVITHGQTSPTYRRLKTHVPHLERCGGFRATAQVQAGWHTTLAVARALQAEAILFQCPASFRPEPVNLARLRRFFGEIEREPAIRLAWEPRGEWHHATIRKICQRFGLIHCVDPFTAEPVDGDTAYFRLHGRGGYRYRYTDGELRALKVMCARRHGLVYVMFNNVFMWDDARRFRALLGSPQ